MKDKSISIFDTFIGGGGNYNSESKSDSHNNKSRKNPLKSLHKQYLFALFKAIKRYYLGMWLIKLPFYALFSRICHAIQSKAIRSKAIQNSAIQGDVIHNNTFHIKAQKYRQKRVIRYESLQNAKERFFTLRTFATQIKAWIHSSAFKAQYAHLPYPPLLNPQNILYHLLPPQLAWEWNLPLPNNYHLLNISSGLSASAATLAFFKECGVNMPDGSFQEIYTQLWQSKTTQNKATQSKTTQSKNAIFFYFTYFNCARFDGERFKATMAHKVPFLFIARDPISKIRGLLNHIAYRAPHCTRFNLTCNVNDLVPKETYMWSGDIEPSFKMLTNPTQHELEWLWATLAMDSIIESFKDNISAIHCIEFNELKGEKCAKTFCNLAKIFGFESPKDIDIFNNRIWNEMYYLLPTTLYAHPSDINKSEINLDSLSQDGGFEITITLPSHLEENQKDFIDISDSVEKNLALDGSKILMLIAKNDLAKLRENNALEKKTIAFLRGYIEAIRKEIARRKAVVFDERQVLAHLKGNHKMRKFLKNTLDSELTYIKTHHPDFIAKWQYYLEFEKICNESQ